MYSMKEYKNAEVELKKFRQIERSEELKEEKIQQEIYSKYQEKKWALEEKIREIEKRSEKQKGVVENKFKKVKAGIDLKAKPYRNIITETEDIFKLIDVYIDGNKELSIVEGAIEMIADDEYKKIGLYILQNRKPVNKYSLVLQGKSLFQYQFDLTSKRDYQTIRDSYLLKDAPSKEILLSWWGKNRDSIIVPFLKRHAELEEKYGEAISLYGFKKWKMAYLMHQKYYYENHYSHGTDTEMYKGVLECMKILKTKQKDLPLLIEEIVTPNGLKELESRLKSGGKI